MTSEDPPVWAIRDMYHQERYNPQDYSSFFADHRTMRTPVAGTVSREGFVENVELVSGTTAEGTNQYAMQIPPAAVEYFARMGPSFRHEGAPATDGPTAMLERGRERYGIYCTPCHGGSGDGMGVVYRRASVTGYQFPEPPTFHQDRLRHAPDGQIFATITNGIRAMPAYAAQIPMYDRWAIVSYVRALQVSQANNRGGAQ